MFKEIGAKFSYKGYADFKTPRVTEEIQKKAPDHTVESMLATRIFTPTEEGQIFAGVFADVARKSFFNLAVGAYLEFQNMYDRHNVIHAGENVFADCYQCFDGREAKHYYFKQVTCEEDSNIMIYNPNYKKCVVMYAVMQEGCETYVECVKSRLGIKVGFIVMKPGISPVRTRVLSGFLIDEKTISGVNEAEEFYHKVSKKAEFDLSTLDLFGEGSLIDICLLNQ